jgi:F420-dependent oxidoreductase-like protein
MRPSFGLQLPSMSFASRPGENVFGVAREIALRAESLGFDSIWLMDHLFQIPVVAPETEPILDCWTGLAGLAAATTRIRLGTLVSAVGFRPPAVLAKISSTLDVISGGRLIAGLGAGWCDWEHAAYGLAFPSTPERLQRLEEAIRILIAMWTEERASFEGRHYQVRNAVCAPKPVQKPHPPILIGGSGARVTLRLTAQYAQAHNLGGGSPAECAKVLGQLREHCDRLGRDYDAIWKTRLTPILFADSEADAETRIAALKPAGESARGFRARTLIGRPEEIAAQLEAFVAAGVEGFITSFWDVDRALPLEILMREVAPKLGAIPSAAR